MSRQSLHAATGRTLRRWTIDSRELVGGSQRAAPALAISQQPGGGQLHRLASKLGQIKSELAGFVR